MVGEAVLSGSLGWVGDAAAASGPRQPFLGPQNLDVGALGPYTSASPERELDEF
jgi:hypothetical protein